MKSLIAENIDHNKVNAEKHVAVKDFYENATADYKHWSKAFNMHFGYYKNGSNPFCREQMLEQMNEKVMQELDIKENTNNTLIDLGCGMGATMRYITSKRKKINAIGYTISDWQVKEGNAMLKADGCKRAVIKLGDITQLANDNEKGRYAIAIESLCHTAGTGKSDAIKHLATKLHKGGRFVIADAFILKKHHKLSRIGKYVHKKICKSWELPTLGNINEMCDNLRKNGFGQLKIENISWRVAPSVLHVPFAIGGFLIKNFIEGKDLNVHSIKNLKGSFATFLSSLCMDDIVYSIISGEKIR